MNAIYDTVVTHARRAPRNRFSHRMYLWLVDLDDLPVLPRPLRPFARFRDRDHLADLRGWLAERGVRLDGGRVRMLAQASVLGYVFNPLTVYWCHDPDGHLECVVAEVHNTYGGRHRYLLRPDANARAAADKEFYVSPFLPMHGHYEMRLPEPDERLAVDVLLRQDGKPSLVATMRGHRRPATAGTLIRMLLTRPLMPQRVAASIRRHGIALWLRRIPIVPRSQETVDE